MTTLFERFSSRDNLRRAYKYVQNELAHSNLSVTPINHPALTAIDALGEQFFTALEKYLRSGKYGPEKGFFVYIPKDNLGIRPVCILSMIDRIVYQAIFNQKILGQKIDGQLSDKVCFSNRVNDDETADCFISPYFNGWDGFCKAQKKAFEKGFVWKAEFDVQQYYEHILANRLTQKLKDDFGIKDEKMLNLLKSQLCTWAEYPDLPKGIPQGPNPSAVLGNVYLSSLDRYAEDELIGKELRYFRYADDIILMGKSREDILKATEKIVRFLRGHNLNLNEKTRVSELQDTEAIEAMRFMSDYELDNSPEIPEDEFTRVQEKVPSIIQKILGGDKVEKPELRELKYYLKVGRGYTEDFLVKLIGIIHLRPSLTIPIVQYISDGREFLRLFGDSMDTTFIDCALCDAYDNSETSEWSKFWILKLLVSSDDAILTGDIEKEMHRILTSKRPTILKVVGFYYEAIHGRNIDIEIIEEAIENSESEVEKALYSFFLLNAFGNMRTPIVRNHIEKTINATSQEMNLIGCYLYQKNPKIMIDDIDGSFSMYILKRKTAVGKPWTGSDVLSVPTSPEYYVVRSDALIPFTESPAAILGLKRIKRHSVELVFPEAVRWEKVKLKMKEGLHDMEIFYDSKHIQTADYAELGFFSGKKQQKPDRQWGFLCALSVLSATDIRQATADKMRDMVAVNSNVTLTTGNVHQIKRTLVKRLRGMFKTDDNPFHDRRDYYQPKFAILPETALRREKNWEQGGRLNENRSSEDDDDGEEAL